MRFKIFFLLIFLFSCAQNTTKIENRAAFNSKGFALIFNENDYKMRVIGGKLDNSISQISHNYIKINTPIKIINPKNNESVVINNSKRIKYPNFYKILITEKVAQILNLDPDFPYVEIFETKKNKSFVAKKAKIFKEEKKISSNAPVASVEISNISKIRKNTLENNNQNMFILIATFYSEDTAKFLKKRISEKMPNYDIKNLKIVKKSNKEINLISGPYKTINLMKNDYTKLINFGFEELDILIND